MEPTDAPDLEQWYEAYGFAVHRRCLRLLGSAVEADDALHEVFLRAQRHAAKRRGQSVLAWLYSITDNHCFTVLRKRQMRADQVRSMSAPDPSTASDELESLQLFRQVLARCKPKVQEVAVLYYVDDWTQEEVAERVGCSRKTVKERLATFKTVATRLLGVARERPGGEG